MNITIEVIKTKDTHFPNAKGGYNILEVTYKNLSSGGKVEGKKLMSFGDYAHVYKAALDWEEDQQVTLESQKIAGRDGKEYWTWVNIIDNGEKEVVATKSVKEDGAKAVNPTKQTWVPDEVKQRMIVRQSSLAQAVNWEKENGATLEDVFATAERMFNWVMDSPFKETLKEETAPPKRVGRPKKAEQAEEEVE